MKNSTSILTKAALAVVIAGSVIACKQPATGNKTATTPAVAVDSKATIVYINQDSLLTKYQYVTDMTKRMNSKGLAAQGDVANREQAIQREVADYQKAAATMSAEQRSQTEERLQRKGQEFQAYRQNASAQMQQEQLSEQSKYYDKINEFLKGYAKEKGYKLILTYQHGSPSLVYGDPSLDITTEVIAKLNEAYAKEKK